MLLSWTSCAIVDQTFPRVETRLLKMKNVVIVGHKGKAYQRDNENCEKSAEGLWDLDLDEEGLDHT